MDINPWQVATIQEFYFLKCPECDFMHREESDFENHAVENHPLSVTFFGEVDMTIEKIGIFDDCNEENESNDALNTVKEEIQETRSDHEMHDQIFRIENEVGQDNIYDVSSSETVNDICPETHEFQDSVEPELSEMSQNVAEVREPPTMIPLLTYEYAAAQIAHAIPARESREVLNEDPIINDVVGLEISRPRDLTTPFDTANHMVSLIRSPISPGTIQPAPETSAVLNVDPTINNAVRIDFSQQMLTQPFSSNLIAPSIVKNGKKKYKCSKCDASFTRRPNLKNHVEVIHEGKNVNQCSICDASFWNSVTLKRHIATVHEGRKPLKCMICDASFARSESLKTHISTVHEGQKQFKCSICDSSFNQSGNLKNHIKSVHEGHKFACRICNKSFRDGHALKRHQKAHKVFNL